MKDNELIETVIEITHHEFKINILGLSKYRTKGRVEKD